VSDAIRIRYMADPCKREEVFEVIVRVKVPLDTIYYSHDEMREIIIEEYEKMDVVKTLRKQLQE
jgi:hypothetical protein